MSESPRDDGRVPEAVFTDADWRQFPLGLGDGQVHVLATRLTPESEASSGTPRLSPEELRRADRFAFATDRQRFVRSHAFLRRVLARYTGVSCTQVEFDHNAHGKPLLRTGRASPSIHFSLSRRGDFALVAVATGAPIGVDVEEVRPMSDCREMAKRFFSRTEYIALEELPESQRTQAFLRCWTRKEAVVKALGEGLSIPLQSFEVALDANTVPVVNFRCSCGAADWTLMHLEPFAGAIGAVAAPFRITGVGAYRLR